MDQRQVKKLKFLWQRISVGKTNDCWEWTGPVTELGYGRANHGGGENKPHRELYKLLHPELDLEGLHVRHLCHNRLCCNPSHLKHGTAKENKLDGIRDGRQIRGEDCGSAKLTNDKVTEIIRRADGGESQTDIAKSLGVSFKTVNRICNGFAWTHITGIRRSA